jgi:hypothetical protein
MTHWNCHKKQKRLTHLAAEAKELTPLLQEHIDRCEGCSVYWREITSITKALKQQVLPVAPSDDFNQRLWQRWQEAQYGTPHIPLRRNSALRWGAVATLFVGVAIWRATSHSKTENQAITPVQGFTVVNNLSLPVKPTPVPTKQGILDTQKPHQIAFKPPKIRRTRTTKRRNTKPIFKPELQLVRNVPRQRPTWTWAQVGTWYAAQGEFANASRAFGRAWAENPTPQTAFVAGEAAELSGDTMQALDYYSRSLMTQPETEKSSERKDKQDDSSRTTVIRRYCLSSQHGEGASAVCPQYWRLSGYSPPSNSGTYRWAEQPDRHGSVHSQHSHARLPQSLEEDEGDFCTKGTPRA